MKTSSMRRWWIRAGVVALILSAAYLAFRPQAVPVDVATVMRAPLRVTVSDDGETRVREVYDVSAPIAGRVLRFQGDVGDAVVAGESILAYMLAARPAFLDVRTRSQLEASVEAAMAARDLAAAEIGRIEAESDFARTELRRAEELATEGAISAADLDRARKEARAAEAALMTASAALDMREHELATARAALIAPPHSDSYRTVEDGLPVRAPVSGTILRILQESEGVVPAGTPLAQVGDPSQLEVVVDLLSSDAVLVSEGDAVEIERWGGDHPLAGVVRRVEPYGVTKLSALGIEEQRVNVIIDLTEPTARWERLGHGYEVEARIVIWEADDVVQVPNAALFRRGTSWATFVVREGLAHLAVVEIGRRNEEMARVLEGLSVGDTVVLYPSDRVADGTHVEQRNLPTDITRDPRGLTHRRPTPEDRGDSAASVDGRGSQFRSENDLYIDRAWAVSSRYCGRTP